MEPQEQNRLLTADFFRQDLTEFPAHQIAQAGPTDSYGSLILDMNNLESFTDEHIAHRSLASLRTVSVAFNQLRLLPPNIGRLTQLEQLICHGNRIEEIPESLSLCSRLNYFNAVGNRLVSLPSSLHSLQHITRLILSDNNLAKFPDAILGMLALDMLDLSGNAAIRTLPESLGALVALSRLRVHTTGLIALPNCLPQLSKLKFIDAAVNDLEDLPANIGECESLKHLDLSFNNFKEIPQVAFEIGLDSFQIQGNPVTKANDVQIDSKLIRFPTTQTYPPDEIIPGLYLSGVQGTYDKHFLKSAKVVGVLAVLPEFKPPFEHLFKYFVVPEEDFPGANLFKYFSDACDWIDAQSAKGSVLVHCRAGVSRSATMLIAYLMQKKGWPLVKTLAFAIRRRSVVHPNHGFINQLLEWEKKLKEEKKILLQATRSAAAESNATDDSLRIEKDKADVMAHEILEEAVYFTQIRAIQTGQAPKALATAKQAVPASSPPEETEIPKEATCTIL